MRFTILSAADGNMAALCRPLKKLHLEVALLQFCGFRQPNSDYTLAEE
jgi:hypothetical protein